MVFQMFGIIAEWERETIIERTKSGRLQRYKDGCFAGGTIPFGYIHNKETRKLDIDENEARIIRRIYSEYKEGACRKTSLKTGFRLTFQPSGII